MQDNASQPASNAPASDLNRRDAVKLAGAGIAAAVAATKFGQAPAIVHAAEEQTKFAVIGIGGRGSYLLKHLNKIEGGKCVMICDLRDEALRKGLDTYKLNTPITSKDYREVLSNKEVDAVIIAVPLYKHFEVTKAALEAGKNTFCEKSLVFTPGEVVALRALVKQYPKQVLQVGLQRRYSKFYQTAKAMIDQGLLGDVTHIHAQWHRNPGWVIKPGGKENGLNWRLFKEFSGGLTAELASHQIDVADWMFGATPEYVVGVGGLDYHKDGRDIFDNIQLIYKYPKGQKLVYSSITTNSHLPYLNATRPEFGECIMGTKGALHLTIGDGESTMPTGMWFREPVHTEATPVAASGGKAAPAVAGASYALGAGQKGLPVLMDKDKVKGDEGFFEREMKFAKLWLLQKGVMVSEEDRNPVETELDSFFNDCRKGGHPKADLEVGLNDSIAVMLSNIAMEQERKVYFNEVEKLAAESTAAVQAGMKKT
jgi:predicted dehydrogenase